MTTNYYTLLRIVKEMKCLVGMKLIECFSQEKDSIVLVFFDGENIKNVFFSAKPNASIIYLDESFSRARKNSVDLMPELLGNYLQNVDLMPEDRVLTFNFVEHTIVFQIFTGASANMLLCDKEFQIIYALNKIEETKYSPRDTNLRAFNDFLGSEKLITALSKCDLLLGKHYSLEILSSLNLDGSKILAEISEYEKLEIFKKAEFFIHSLVFGSKSYILKAEPEPIFSLATLTAYPELIAEFDSVSKAVKKARIMKIRQKIENAARKEILPVLLGEKKRIEKRIEDCKNIGDALKRTEAARMTGELLMSMPNPKSKPINDFINLIDYSGNEIIVQIDTKLDFIQNAEKYFSKAKKSVQDMKIKKQRLPLYEKKYEEVCQIIKDFEATCDIAALKKFKSLLRNKKIGKNMNQENKTASEKYKTFELGDGFILYVGKNAANNDELTMKFAKPNDLWMHARGTSGSHAVLPLNGMEKAPKPILKKAAEITAYYSGARNAKYVPVCYTLKKNVRKPKGANVGAVVITREEVIMVEPRIPEE